MKSLLLTICSMMLSLSAFAGGGTVDSDNGKPFQVKLPAKIDGESRPLVQDIAKCRADVNDYVSWGEQENQKQAGILCAIRKEHQEAKEAFVQKLQHLTEVTADLTNHGRNMGYRNAVKQAIRALALCIDANEQLSYPHNIAAIISPEQLRIECYKWAETLPALYYPEVGQ